MIIEKALEKIALESEADRVVIAFIHPKLNLESKTEEGFNIIETVFSIHHEYCREGTKSIKNIVKDKPISILKLESKNIEQNIMFAKCTPWLPSKCSRHFHNIGCEVIINQFINSHYYTLGIFSMQYKNMHTAKYRNKEQALKNKEVLYRYKEEITSIITKVKAKEKEINNNIKA